jgi:hypothetical protein
MIIAAKPRQTLRTLTLFQVLETGRKFCLSKWRFSETFYFNVESVYISRRNIIIFCGRNHRDLTYITSSGLFAKQVIGITTPV